MKCHIERFNHGRSAGKALCGAELTVHNHGWVNLETCERCVDIERRRAAKSTDGDKR